MRMMMSAMADRQTASHYWSTWWEAARDAQTDPREAARLVREANSRGEHMLALALGEKALAHISLVAEPSAAAALRGQMALALARSGATEEAMEVLQDSLVAGPGSAETLGLCGRLHKDLAERAANEKEALEHRGRALEFYAEGFAREGDAYCGINAAVLAALTGDLPRARETAQRVLRTAPVADRLWATATEAMARMLCGEMERAREALTRVDRAGTLRRSDLAAVRREARRLAVSLSGDASWCDGCFRPAAVAIFAGRGDVFPGDARLALARWLERNHVVCAWAAVASGEEAGFLEGAAALGVETCAVLPHAHPPASGAKAVARAALTEVLDEGAPIDPQSAGALARQLATARAVARAASWDVPLLAVASGSTVPAGWRRLARAPFKLEGSRITRDEGVKPETAEGGLTAMLCVRVDDAGTKHPRNSEAVHRLCDGHEARLVVPGEPENCYFFAWPTPGAAGRAALDLQQQAAAACPLVSCTFVLHASANGRTALRGWAERVHPGRVHATGRFADLAAAEDGRDFELCYLGTLDREAAPLGMRLYQLRALNSARGGGAGLRAGERRADGIRYGRV